MVRIRSRTNSAYLTSIRERFFLLRHTAIAVFGAIELSRMRRNWLIAAAVLLALFEVATVLILRAHYAMDVFAGIVAAL